MTKLLYDQDALDRARAEGVATASVSFEAKIAEMTGKVAASVAHGASLLAAMTTLAPDNAKIAIFSEAITDGASVALAGKLAAKIETPVPAVAVAAVPAPAAVARPTRTQADIDAFMSGHAPNISGGEADAADPKAKRKAELAANLAPLKRK